MAAGKLTDRDVRREKES